MLLYFETARLEGNLLCTPYTLGNSRASPMQTWCGPINSLFARSRSYYLPDHSVNAPDIHCISQFEELVWTAVFVISLSRGPR